MIEASQIERMSTAERLQAMEQLWHALAADPERVPSPKWHEQVLASRKERVQKGEAKFLSMEELSARLHSSAR